MAKKKTTPAEKKEAKPPKSDTHPQPSEPVEPHLELYVVGIGASAGGLEAMKQLVGRIEPDSGLAYVMISHLDPRQPTMLPEILRKSTKVPIQEVTSRMKIEKDHIYIIPPDRQLTIQDGHFVLKPRPENEPNLPINLFLMSLADACGEKAIGVILSGTGSDGVQGLRRIKEKLGIVIVQKPESAQYKGMPTAAISTGLVDQILDPEEIPSFAYRYSRQSLRRSRTEGADKSVTKEKVREVCTILRKRTGHDFSNYKQNTVMRRIGKRMDLHQIDHVDQYLRFLEESEHEVNTLFKELLIGVTNFFRDPEAFEIIRQKILPAICDKPEGASVRLWIPGVSTGEEAYSIAILLHEYLSRTDKLLKPSIFGTDIDELAIEKARAGIFGPGIANEIDKDRLARYFTKKDNGYVINRTIREMVIFAPQSLIKDPPFSRLDFISCRNVLIYMNSNLQKKLVPLFFYSLNPGGFLFLGSSEGVGESMHLFEAVDSKWKIYRKRLEAGGAYPALEFPLTERPENGVPPSAAPKRGDISGVAKAELLEQFVPPSVIINRGGEILYIHGRTGKFLEPAAGKARLDVQEMAREGLRMPLPALIRHAAVHNSPAVRLLAVRTNGDLTKVKVTVRPCASSSAVADLLVITFEEVVPSEPGREEAARDDGHSYEHLEQELKVAKESLQSTVEELETSNEELRSMNEEYQSTNEELKSANEELETGREELQSLNEELSTVNSELQEKIERLSESQREMQLFLNSLDIPTIFMDEQLQIVRFTEQAAQIFHIIESDYGRPIHHFASNLRDEHFMEDIKKVRSNLQYIEREVQTLDGRWLLRRTVPYRTVDNRLGGVVVNFVDIDETKRTRVELEKNRALTQSISKLVNEPLVILGLDDRVTLASDSFYRTFNLRTEEVERRRLVEIIGGMMDTAEVKNCLEAVKSGSKTKSVVVHRKMEAGRIRYRFSAEPVAGGDGSLQFIVLSINEIEREEG